MHCPHPLDRLVARDSFAEIIALLEPEELIIATLRLEELTDAQIGEILGISRAAVSQRMHQACQRIVQQRPDLGHLLADRRPRGAAATHAPRPLEQGYICRWEEKDGQLPDLEPDLTTREVAHRFDVSPQAVGRWVRAGYFPNAYRCAEQGGYRIPEGDLEVFCPLGPGGSGRRPRKSPA